MIKPGTRPSHITAILLLIITAFLWSLGGVLIKYISCRPMAIAGIRSILAAVVMLAVIRRKHLTFSSAQIGGALSYCATVIFFVTSTKMTTAANAILLQYTAPVYVAVLGVFILREKVKLFDWLTIAFAIIGIMLLFFDRLTVENLYGNLMAILSGVSFAFLIVLTRKQKDASPIGSIFMGNIITAVIGLPFIFNLPPDGRSWIALLALGILQLGLSYILYSIAIKHVTALEGIMILMIEPVLNPVWVFLFIGESPGKLAIPGGIIVIAAVTASAWIRISGNVENS